MNAPTNTAILSRKKLIALIQTQKNEIIALRDQLENIKKARLERCLFNIHEFRTPLASILGLANLLIDEVNLNTDDIEKTIDSIKCCASYLLDLVQNMLYVNQLENNNTHVSFAFVKLEKIINELYQLLNVLAKNKNLSLYLKLDSKSTIIFTNEQILRQILINLIGNAIKFTTKGNITIQTHILLQDESKAAITINIIDTGLGIPKDQLDLIFKPFTCFNHTTSDQSNGLGLFIVNQLAELINVKIHATSILGEGSIFSINGVFKICPQPLDLTHSSSPASSNTKKHHKLNKIKELSKKNIPFDLSSPNDFITQAQVLLIEDDFIAQYIHEKILLSFGCFVDIIALGKNFSRISKKYDIVFLDANLPDVSGLNIVKKIRNNENYSHVPIIILSAHITDEEKANYYAAGVNECLKKPVSQHHFKELLLNYCKNC